MFTQISWSDYLITVIVLLALYYFIIAIRYYRQDLIKLLSGKQSDSLERLQSTNAENNLVAQKPHEAYMQQSVEEQNLFKLLQSLSDEVQAFLNQAANGELDKGEIISSLKVILVKYALLKDSTLSIAVRKFIQSSCETECSVRLSDEEVSDLWN